MKEAATIARLTRRSLYVDDPQPGDPTASDTLPFHHPARAANRLLAILEAYLLPTNGDPRGGAFHAARSAL